MTKKVTGIFCDVLDCGNPYTGVGLGKGRFKNWRK